MNQKEKTALNKMISENNVEDQTEKIRTLKHSDLIKQDVFTLQKLKNQYSRTRNTQVFKEMCVSRCSFLFNNYTDIFNRLVKDEIDMNILAKLLFYLKKIEDGELDQHTGSFEVGKVLKEMYIDSAIKRGNKTDAEESENKPVEKPAKNVSWHQFKKCQEIESDF